VVLEEVCAELEAEGYAVQPFIIPAAAVSAPHRRDRVWIVAYARSRGAQLEPLPHTITERKEFIDESEVWNATDADCRGLQIPQFETDEPKANDIFSASLLSQYQWENWPTVSPVCSGNDGLPGELDGITFPKWRNESIKGYGNAIVPQVAMQIFAAIEQYEQLTKEIT
jgi:DNA (cytosine-5)-methyltransferase 1